MKLSQKLLLAVLPVLGLVLSLGGWLLIRQNFHRALSELQYQAETTQQRELYALQLDLRAGEEDVTAALMEYGASVSRYVGEERGFALFTGEGVLAYSAVPEDVPLTWQQALLADPSRGVLRSGQEGRWYLIADAVPAAYGSTVYYVGVYPMDAAYDTQQSLLASYFWIELLAFGAAGGAVWWMISRLTRPLHTLEQAGREIAAGAYDRRTGIGGSDEIAALSRSFDDMTAALEEELGRRALAVQQREDFITALTHELKTPMTSILGYAQMMRTAGDDLEVREKSAAYIAHEARRIEALSRKLLRLMEVEQEGVTLSVLLVEELLTALRRALPETALPLRVQAPREPVTVLGDADLLCALLLNLISNARRAEPRDGAVHLDIAAEGEEVRFTVWDTGRGIPAEDLPRLTEPFYMVDKSRSRAQNGSGIGLALCQTIARAHGTCLTFASKVGEGTRVSFCLTALPRKEEPHADTES